MNKILSDRRLRISSTVFSLLLFVFIGLIVYINHPLNPRNISAETVCKKGTGYTVKLKGISEYDENGFSLAADGFHFSTEKLGVSVSEDGFAYTDYDKNGEVTLDGRYCSGYIIYDDYVFCGETYKTKEELQQFFDSPDPIYGFDINELSYYVQDIINYEKKFSGKATLKIYRGKAVITEIFIGEEKTLQLK